MFSCLEIKFDLWKYLMMIYILIHAQTMKKNINYTVMYRKIENKRAGNEVLASFGLLAVLYVSE